MERDFMTLADVAARLGLTYRRTHALAKAGVLPATRRGGRWVVPVRAWERWLDQQAEEALASMGESGARGRERDAR